MRQGTERRWISASPEDTFRLARELLAEWGPGTVVALHGELGAGKTTFVQGLARALGIHEPVNSPTFTLVNVHHGERTLYHVDLYRLHDDAEAMTLGLDDLLFGQGLTAIEWAERIANWLPPGTVHLFLQPGAHPNERLFILRNPPPLASAENP